MRPPVIDLLCLPCAGASATMYLRWRRLLPEWIRVVPVELPGRGARLAEPACTDFATLVAQLQAEHVPPSGPYALFGHSMGALLAYGLARRLPVPPEVLMVSASPAPGRRDASRFAAADDDTALMADLRRQGGTPEAVFDSPELLRLTLDTMAADYRVCASFDDPPVASLTVPVHVLGGRDDDIAADRLDDWRHVTRAGFSREVFAGGHFFIRTDEAAVLTAIVQRLLHTVAAMA